MRYQEALARMLQGVYGDPELYEKTYWSRFLATTLETMLYKMRTDTSGF